MAMQVASSKAAAKAGVFTSGRLLFFWTCVLAAARQNRVPCMQHHHRTNEKLKHLHMLMFLKLKLPPYTLSLSPLRRPNYEEKGPIASKPLHMSTSNSDSSVLSPAPVPRDASGS